MQASISLAREVASAMRLGVHLLLVHEVPCAVGRRERGACEFSEFFQDGWTPTHLLRANIYGEIAIALKDGAWRRAGLAILRSKLGARLGDRTPIEVHEPDGFARHQELLFAQRMRLVRTAAVLKLRAHTASESLCCWT